MSILFINAGLVKNADGQFIPELPDALDTCGGWVIGVTNTLDFNEIVYAMEMLPRLYAVYTQGYRFDYDEDGNLQIGNITDGGSIIKTAIADTCTSIDPATCLYLGAKGDNPEGMPFELLTEWLARTANN